METAELFTQEFTEIFVEAGLRARERALAAGHPVVYSDEFGRYVEEHADGRKLEIRFHDGAPRDSHIEVLGEISPSVK